MHGSLIIVMTVGIHWFLLPTLKYSHEPDLPSSGLPIDTIVPMISVKSLDSSSEQTIAWFASMRCERLEY